jgi:hypothetical protein
MKTITNFFKSLSAFIYEVRQARAQMLIKYHIGR